MTTLEYWTWICFGVAVALCILLGLRDLLKPRVKKKRKAKEEKVNGNRKNIRKKQPN